MSVLLIVLLVVLLFGGVSTYPRWNHSANWGYGPSGLLGFLLLIIVVLALVGHAPF